VGCDDVVPLETVPSLRAPVTLLLLLALAAGASAQQPTTEGPATPAPQAGTRLVYDLPAYDLGRLMDTNKGATIDSLVADVVARLQARLGLRAIVSPLGGTAFAVDVHSDALSVTAVRLLVEAKTFEMRVVATSDYRADGVAFDLAEEKKRLERWLAGGGKQLVVADPRQIERFNDDPVHGPLAARHLRWMPHVVETQLGDATAWEMPFSLTWNSGKPPVADSTVAVFDGGTDFNRGQVPAHLKANPRLLEFVAINWHEVYFCGADLIPNSVAVVEDSGGHPAIRYQVRNSRAAEYAEWTGKYIRKHFAVLVDGRVRSAPYFVSRISGHGQISGNFTAAEVAAMEMTLRRGDLPMAPKLLRQEPLAPR
jgi:hypothetical protein